MSDTSSEAAALQIRIQRSLSGAERLRIALEMSATMRALALTRLRKQHPDWSDAQLMLELLRYAGATLEPPDLE
jgi:hypothetical protein